MTVRIVYRPENSGKFLSRQSPGAVPFQKQRWISFSGSLVIHAALIMALAMVREVPVYTNSPGTTAKNPFAPKYSLTVLHFETPDESQSAVVAEASKSMADQPKSLKKHELPSKVEQHTEGPPWPPSESPKRVKRQFVVPSPSPETHVVQTLIVEATPITVTTQEVHPPLLSWTVPTLRPPSRRFVAPSSKAATNDQPNLQVAPVLEAPNLEVAVGNINLARTSLNDLPLLVRPPSTTSPVSSQGPDPSQNIPQVALARSDQPVSVNVISESDPKQASSILVTLPPANQVAPADRGGGGLSKVGPSNNGGGGSPKSGSPAGSPGIQGISVSGNLPGLNSVASADQSMPGVSRIMQPPNGKFAVVVQGSPDSSRYPASAGILGGSIVSTVYLRVGTRRNWILQYIPARDEAVARIGGASIEAPWPLVMMRLDAVGTQTNYVVMHGKVTASGDFDQLSIVFPVDFDKKDLLLKSLKLWKFRPAVRDGEAVGVEVLLIIPQQTN